jgi:hypothetical protein
MSLFDKEILDRAVELHSIEGRMEWKYKPMTEKQWAILEPCVPDAMRSMIDRGAAAMLIQEKFDRDKEARAYGYDSCAAYDGDYDAYMDGYYPGDGPLWVDDWWF